MVYIGVMEKTTKEREMTENGALDRLKTQTPAGRMVTITYRPVDHSSRTAQVRGEVLSTNEAGSLWLGQHPDTYLIPWERIEGIGR